MNARRLMDVIIMTIATIVWTLTGFGILLHVGCNTANDVASQSSKQSGPALDPSSSLETPVSGTSFIETSLGGVEADASSGGPSTGEVQSAQDDHRPYGGVIPDGPSNANTDPKAFIDDTDADSAPNLGAEAEARMGFDGKSSEFSYLDSICAGFNWVRADHCNWCKPEESREVVIQHQCAIPARCGEGDFGVAGWGYSHKRCP